MNSINYIPNRKVVFDYDSIIKHLFIPTLHGNARHMLIIIKVPLMASDSFKPFRTYFNITSHIRIVNFCIDGIFQN